jgi:Fur family peroxide stress response transcriptional regulator
LRVFEQRCRDAGFPLTVQRRVVLEAMAMRNDHPTAEQICKMIQAQVPEISRATVYRALESLVQLGVIGRAHHFGAATRFDANPGHHHHLVCVRCNRVTDYEDERLEDVPLPSRAHSGFQTMDYSVHFHGLCPDCQAYESSTS